MKTFLLAIMLCVAFISNAQTITTRNTLKGWFITGAKPTQAQYWAWLDSYWHKNDLIPVSSITGLGDYMTFSYISNDTLFGVTSDTVFVIGVLDVGNTSIDSFTIKYNNLDYLTDTPRVDAISGNKYLITHNPPHFLADGTTVNLFYTHKDNIAIDIGGTYSYNEPDTGDIAVVVNPVTTFYKYNGVTWKVTARNPRYGGDSLGTFADLGTRDHQTLRFITNSKIRFKIDASGKLYATFFKGISADNVLKIVDPSTGEIGWDSTKPFYIQAPLFWVDSAHTILGSNAGSGGSGSFNFDSALATKTTDNLTQGSTNLYNQTHTGDATGATALTVVGIRTKSIPTLSAGFLKYTGSAWAFDNTTYLSSYTETDPLSVHISDSAAMLLPYLRKIDTTGKWIGVGWLATLAAKQNAITTGTTLQYIRGDLSLSTFPTTVSTFTNDAGYLTNTTGDARYFKISNNLSEGTASTMRTNLGATTVGANLFTLSNPSAIRYIQINADNSITLNSANAHLNALLPSQTGNNTKVLQTDGTNTSWATVSGGSSYTAGRGIKIVSTIISADTTHRLTWLNGADFIDTNWSVITPLAVTFTKQANHSSTGTITGASFRNISNSNGFSPTYNVAAQFTANRAVNNVAVYVDSGVVLINKSPTTMVASTAIKLQAYGNTGNTAAYFNSTASNGNDGAIVLIEGGSSTVPASLRLSNSLVQPVAINMNYLTSLEENAGDFFLRYWAFGNLSRGSGSVNVIYASGGNRRIGINTSSTPIGLFEAKNTGIVVGTGAVTSGGNTLTGTSTTFQSDIKVGDVISVATVGSYTVASIASNTSLTITGTWASSASGKVITNSTTQNLEQIVALANGRTGINTATPAYTLDVNGDGNFAAAIRKTRPDIATGSTPSNSLGTGAGTSPTASITGNDISGYVTINTGTTPTAGGDVITITFATALTNTPTSIILTAANENAAVDLTKIYVDQASASTTSFKIKNISATALQASTTYKFYYHITQ